MSVEGFSLLVVSGALVVVLGEPVLWTLGPVMVVTRDPTRVGFLLVFVLVLFSFFVFVLVLVLVIACVY